MLSPSVFVLASISNSLHPSILPHSVSSVSLAPGRANPLISPGETREVMDCSRWSLLHGNQTVNGLWRWGSIWFSDNLKQSELIFRNNILRNYSSEYLLYVQKGLFRRFLAVVSILPDAQTIPQSRIFLWVSCWSRWACRLLRHRRCSRCKKLNTFLAFPVAFTEYLPSNRSQFNKWENFVNP